jgi:hypothetical protein
MKELSALILSILMSITLASCNGTEAKEKILTTADPLTPSVTKDEDTYVRWKMEAPAEVPDGDESYLDTLKTVGDQITFRCPEEGCHPSVAMLLSRGRCEATLISPDEVLTANHCIQPDQVPVHNRFIYTSAFAESCSKTVVIFPASSQQPHEIIPCRSVSGLLRHPTDRPFLKMNSVTNTKQKTAVVIDFIEKGLYEETVINCTELSAENKYNVLTMNKAFEKCDFKRGNSGGPILNEHGEIWGVISRILTPYEEITTPVATNVKCPELFYTDPYSGMNECLTELDDMNKFLIRTFPGLPEKKTDERYYSGNIRTNMVGILPLCISDLRGKKTITFENKVCRLSERTNKVFDCEDGFVRFNADIDFGPYYFGNVTISYKHVHSGDVYSLSIKKCEDVL